MVLALFPQRIDMTAKRFCMLAAVPLFSAVAVMWLAPHFVALDVAA